MQTPGLSGRLAKQLQHLGCVSAGGRKPCVSTDDAFMLLQVKLASGRPPMHLLPMPCVKPVAMASFVALLQTFANSSLRDLPWLAAEYPTCWTPDSQALGHRLERLPFGHP